MPMKQPVIIDISKSKQSNHKMLQDIFQLSSYSQHTRLLRHSVQIKPSLDRSGQQGRELVARCYLSGYVCARIRITLLPFDNDEAVKLLEILEKIASSVSSNPSNRRLAHDLWIIASIDIRISFVSDPPFAIEGI
nr:PREDICTED: uncharacterized protein LOC105663482 [Megachile rotundata]